VTILVEIESLESLSVIDAELKSLNEQLQVKRSEIEAKQEKLVQLTQRLERGRSSVTEMERARSELSQEVRQMTLQIDRSREKLARCRNEKEIVAVQREMEELRKLIRDREVESNKLNELAEQARGETEQVSTEQSALQGDLSGSADSVQGEIAQLDERIRGMADARAAAVAKLKPQLYRRYETIRQRRGSGVSRVVPNNGGADGLCGACCVMLSPSAFQQLRRLQELSQCPSCNRILYYKPEAESGAVVTPA
jgi:predicted  nucleic acid-binding Zn-ribbon protein